MHMELKLSCSALFPMKGWSYTPLKRFATGKLGYFVEGQERRVTSSNHMHVNMFVAVFFGKCHEKM